MLQLCIVEYHRNKKLNSSGGLITIQIGVMFALLFAVIGFYNFSNIEYLESVIENQRKIIEMLNHTADAQSLIP